MPNHPEADEAQHGHYNDGYESHPTLTNLNDPRHSHQRYDPPSEANVRYGQISQRMPRRYKALDRVELLHSNFVLDSDVPTKLLDRSPLRNEREFTHMRYSAVTCDPNDFKDSGFTLRQVHYDPPRRTELFILMTLCNEDEELFGRSMHAVMKNIAHLCKRDRSRTWGKDGWKKVVVCIVSDGRQNINSRTLSVLATMGAYQQGIDKNTVNGKPVTAHIYEYTTQVSVLDSPSLQIEAKDIFPVQIIFCLKEQYQGKINSHRWCFNAFGPILQPNICVLLDVGAVPGPTSIYHLWKIFDIKTNVGGACGEIVTDKGKYGRHLLNPLVAAQNFEYKMSNILDKPLESVFGYVTALPSAFSAYRYIALQNDRKGEGPLQKYFSGEKMYAAGADVFTPNIAGERVLSWELVSKREGSWILHYVKSAYAVIDVPDGVPESISQRRRWLNGSFFGATHTIPHFHYIYRSSHSFLRKFWLHVEMFYQLYNLIFSWFALGNYYIAFFFFTDTLEHYLSILHYPNLVFNYFYLSLLIMSFILSLSNRPQCPKWAYTVALLGFSLIMIYMMVSAFLLAYKGIESIARSEGHAIQVADFLANTLFRNIVLSTSATLGLYIVSSLLFFEPWHMITSFIPYLLMIPSYIMVFDVYALANIYDVPWDTASTDLGLDPAVKGADEKQAEVAAPSEKMDANAAYERATALLSAKLPKEKERMDPATQQGSYFETFRKNVLLMWTLSNALLAMIVISAIPSSGSGEMSIFANVYMSFLLFSITGVTFVRFLGSTAYLVIWLIVGE